MKALVPRSLAGKTAAAADSIPRPASCGCSSSDAAACRQLAMGRDRAPYPGHPARVPARLPVGSLPRRCAVSLALDRSSADRAALRGPPGNRCVRRAARLLVSVGARRARRGAAEAVLPRRSTCRHGVRRVQRHLAHAPASPGRTRPVPGGPGRTRHQAAAPAATVARPAGAGPAHAPDHPARCARRAAPAHRGEGRGRPAARRAGDARVPRAALPGRGGGDIRDAAGVRPAIPAGCRDRRPAAAARRRPAVRIRARTAAPRARADGRDRPVAADRPPAGGPHYLERQAKARVPGGDAPAVFRPHRRHGPDAGRPAVGLRRRRLRRRRRSCRSSAHIPAARSISPRSW